MICDRCNNEVTTNVKGESPWWCHHCEQSVVSRVDGEEIELAAAPLPISLKGIDNLLRGDTLQWYDGEYNKAIRIHNYQPRLARGISHCWFCGALPGEQGPQVVQDGGLVVHCERCDARGPLLYGSPDITEQNAIDAWNEITLVPSVEPK